MEQSVITHQKYTQENVTTLGLDPLRPGPLQQPRSGTTLIHKVLPMNLRLKSNEDRLSLINSRKLYPDFCCPLVNHSIFINSGPIMRVFNNGISGAPYEIGVLRLRGLHESSIPEFLYHNKLTLKKWAIEKIFKSLLENGSSHADHPKVKIDHFTAKFTVGTVNPGVRAMMGSHDPGLWVFHFPEMLQMIRGFTYEDGSCEEFHLINFTVNLIPPNQRIRAAPAGGPAPGQEPNYQTLRKETDGPAEKRFRPNSHKAASTIATTMASAMSKDQEIEELKKSVAALQQNPALQYPQMPKSNVMPGGMTQWDRVEDDMPQFVS